MRWRLNGLLVLTAFVLLLLPASAVAHSWAGSLNIVGGTAYTKSQSVRIGFYGAYTTDWARSLGRFRRTRVETHACPARS